MRSDIDPESGSPRRPEKIYREVKTKVREQRREESKEYSNHRESANIIVSDLVANLKRSLSQREGHDEEIVNLLGEMEEAVETGDLRQIRRVAGRTSQRDQGRDRHPARAGPAPARGSVHPAARTCAPSSTRPEPRCSATPLTELHNRGAFDDSFEKTVELAPTAVRHGPQPCS